MEIKRCPKCKEYKLRAEFYKDKSRKDGLKCHCKACRLSDLRRWTKENRGRCSAYMKEYFNKKRKFYREYKKNLKCQQCGEAHPACLEFHHRNPEEKEFGIGHSIEKKSVEQVMNEIAKCDVLCANCHKKLHYDLKRN